MTYFIMTLYWIFAFTYTFFAYVAFEHYKVAWEDKNKQNKAFRDENRELQCRLEELG